MSASSAAARPGKYRAAATHMAVDDDPLSANETILLTNTTAALPSSGTLVVDMYFSQV